jgi:hypothetical protein
LIFAYASFIQPISRDADDEEGEDIEGEDDEGEDDEGEDDEPLAKKGKTGKVVKAPVTDSSDIEIMVYVAFVSF